MKNIPRLLSFQNGATRRFAVGAGFHSDFYLDHDTNGYHILFRDKNRKTGECKAVFGKNEKGDITKFLDEYLDDLNGTKDKGYISFITCNHDTPRMTRMFSELEAKIAYSFIFMLPGVPFLYYGDEIGMSYMEGLTSKEGGFSRTGSRTPMQWTIPQIMDFQPLPQISFIFPSIQPKTL